MPRRRETEQPETWTCPFCQQTVRVDGRGLHPSDDFSERCLLPEHIVNDECVAFRNPRKARELMMERD
jgi:hypothetical protein